MSEVEPCLWLRGILPAKYTILSEQYKPPDLMSLSFTNRISDPIVWGSGTYYGDASGGIFSSLPVLRRVGVGVARMSTDNLLEIGVHTRLPGPIQTVPRGELFAVLTLAMLVEDMASINFCN